MSAEYDGKMDRGTDGQSKGFKILPRPLTDPKDQLRSLLRTGDPSGFLDASFDDGMFIQGLEHFRMRQFEAQQAAVVSRFTAIDEAWYD